MNASDTLDFLIDLAGDGVANIRCELFQQLDSALLAILAAEFPMPVTIAAPEFGPEPEDDNATFESRKASRSGRAAQFTSARVIRDLRRLGFVRRKSTSGHRIFVHPAKRGGHVAVPHHSGDLCRGTLSNILRQASAVLGDSLVIDANRSRLVLKQPYE